MNEHVLIWYGMLEMPAVVAREENAGLAVQYFDKVGKSSTVYAAQDQEYEMLRNDIIRNIPAPKMEFRGSHIYFKFSEI